MGSITKNNTQNSETIVFHNEQILITKTGTFVAICSIIIDSDEIKENQTIFDRKPADGDIGQEETVLDENHSGYELSQKLVGFY